MKSWFDFGIGVSVGIVIMGAFTAWLIFAMDDAIGKLIGFIVTGRK
jgi:hypothetical protein